VEYLTKLESGGGGGAGSGASVASLREYSAVLEGAPSVLALLRNLRSLRLFVNVWPTIPEAGRDEISVVTLPKLLARQRLLEKVAHHVVLSCLATAVVVSLCHSA
jgi:hypothetical protein